MAEGEGKINVFNLWEKGVVNHKDPLHVIDGELMQSQNVVSNNPDEGKGGLEKRGGMAKLNSVAMSGAVQGLTNVPLEDPVKAGVGNIWLYVAGKGRVNGVDNTFHNLGGRIDSVAHGVPYFNWIQLSDAPGAADDHRGIGLSASTGTTTVGNVQYDGRLSAAFPATTHYRAGGAANPDSGNIIYASDDYTIDTEAPRIRCFTGLKDFEVARIPEWFNAGVRTHAKAIIRLIAFDNYVYLSTWDGGSGTDLQGRVFRLDPASGTLLLIGQPFGAQAGEAVGGMPFALCGWNGRLWAGTASAAASPAGKVYWIRPGIDDTWTLDHTCTAGQGNVLALAGYAFTGSLYVGTDGVGGVAGLVLARTPAGVWTTSDTGLQIGTRNRYDLLVEFESYLYAHYWEPDTSPGAGQWVIRQFDGISWTTALDVWAYTFAHDAVAAPQTMSGNAVAVYPEYLVLTYGNGPAITDGTGGAIVRRAGVWGVTQFTNVISSGGHIQGYIRTDEILNLNHL